MAEELKEFVESVRRIATTVGDDLEKPVRACVPILRAAVDLNFANRTTPDRGTWPARKDPGPTHPLLVLSGALRAAATQEGAPGHVERMVGNNEVEYGLNTGTDLGGIPGAGRHNFGDDPPGIRQREYLGANEDHVDAMAEEFADWLLQEVS